jgi:sec-independent protein translocase protein TatC
MDNNTINNTTLISHLIELRKRLVRAFSIVILLFFILVYWAPQIYNIFIYPLNKLLPANSHLVFGDVTSAFMVPIKITFLLSFMISLPWVIYQAWAFIAPGLYANEKRLILPLVLSSYILFWLGVCFVYFIILPMVFKFMVSYSTSTGTPMLTQANEYLDFVIQLFISFGVIFEIPIAIIILNKVGIVSVQQLSKIRPYVIVASFIIAAIVTPPDPFSQIMMAVPICLLYEIGLLIVKNGVKIDS